jgi:hypothetical protein
MSTQTKLATAISLALGTSLAAIPAAQASSVFFPYVVSGGSVTTIVSVMNTGALNYATNGTIALPGAVQNLHYRLYFKTGAAASNNAAVCQEFNRFLPTSKNDIQTIDLGGWTGTTTLGVLFNDPSINNNWVAAGRNYAMAAPVTPMRGYLVVDNATPVPEFTVTGEAIILDFQNRAAWGYEAYSRGTDLAGTEFDYRPYASRNGTTVTAMPFAETMTAFFVTPVDQNMAPPINNYTATIALQTIGDDGQDYALYDRDENPISGSLPETVTCVGRVDFTDLITLGALSVLQDGGWGSLINFRGTPAAPGVAPGAIVTKLEYNVGNTFNGDPVPGVFNNGFMLDPLVTIP